MAKPVLGRGLSALLGGNSASKQNANVFQSAASAVSSVPATVVPDTREHVEKAPISRVHPCPFQPRKDFPQESLRELADSIKEQGIVQPLIVRKQGDGYELIAGERRLRAVGIAEGRLLVCIYTARGPGLYRIISLRPANSKERDAHRAAYPG